MEFTEFLAVLPPAFVIIALLAGLFTALQRGHLRTDREVSHLQEDNDKLEQAYWTERARGDELAAAVDEIRELARLILDLLTAIRDDKER